MTKQKVTGWKKNIIFIPLFLLCLTSQIFAEQNFGLESVSDVSPKVPIAGSAWSSVSLAALNIRSVVYPLRSLIRDAHAYLEKYNKPFLAPSNTFSQQFHRGHVRTEISWNRPFRTIRSSDDDNRVMLSPAWHPLKEQPLIQKNGVMKKTQSDTPLQKLFGLDSIQMKFITAATLILFTTIVALFIILIFVRYFRALQFSKFDRKTKKHKDIIDLLAKEGSMPLEDGTKRVKGLNDSLTSEMILEKAASIKGVEASQFRELYDATGVTERYINMLQNAEAWSKRAFAAEKLGQIGSAKSVPTLLSVVRNIKDEDEDVRNVSLRALGRIKDMDAIPELIKALGTPETWLPPRVAEVLFNIGEASISYLILELKNYANETSRAWSAEILGRLNARQAVMPIIEALFDVNPEVRAKAAGALGNIKDARAVTRLSELLISEPVPFVRTRVARALGNINHPAVLDYLITSLKDPEWWVRVRVVEALEELGEKSISALLFALEDKDREVSKRSAIALERIGYVEKVLEAYEREEFKHDLRKELYLVAKSGVVNIISEKLNSPNITMQKKIVRLLGETKAKSASEGLLSLLMHTEEWTLKARIIESLGNIGAKEAVSPLIQCLHDSQYWVRSSAIDALAKLEATDRTVEISHMLKDKSPLTRESALKALSRLNATEHEKNIAPLLNDPSAKVRGEAIRTFRELGLTANKERVLALASDPSEDVRLEAIRYYAAKADESVIENILHHLPQASETSRSEILEYLRSIKPGSFQNIVSLFIPEELSAGALFSLMEIAYIIRDEDAHEFILGFTDNPDPFLRAKAFHEIASIWFDPNRKRFEKAIFDPSSMVRIQVLAGIGTNAAKDLLEKALALSKDPDENVRSALVLACGASGLSDFKDFIHSAINDPSARVGAAAMISMASLQDPLLPVVVQSREHVKQVKEEIQKITEDIQFNAFIAAIKEQSKELGNLETELLLSINDRDFAYSILKKIKEDLDPAVRIKALDIMTMIYTEEFFTEILVVMKRDPSEQARIKAMEVITSKGRDDKIISALTTMIVDPAHNVRVRAAEIFGRFKSKKAFQALIHVLNSTDRNFRETVTSSLSDIVSKSPDLLDDLLKYSPERKAEKIGLTWLAGKYKRKGSKKILLNLLHDTDRDVRASAIGALSKFREKQLLAIIEKHLLDPDERVRAAAVNAIAAGGGDRALYNLVSALEDPDKFVRMRGALGLAKLDIKRAVEIIQSKSGMFSEFSSYLMAIHFFAGTKYDYNVKGNAEARSFICALSNEEELIHCFRHSPDQNLRLHAFRMLVLLDVDRLNDIVNAARNDPYHKIRDEALKAGKE